jgi:hypothetical protein
MKNSEVKQSVMLVLLGVTWRYTLSTIARQLKEKILADPAVSTGAKLFLDSNAADEMFIYYFHNQLWSVEPTGEPERSILRQFKELRRRALIPLHGEGSPFTEREAQFWESLAFAARPEFLGHPDGGSVLDILNYNHEARFIAQLTWWSRRYELVSAVKTLEDIESQLSQ